MEGTTATPQREQFFENLYAIANSILKWFVSHPVIAILLVVGVVLGIVYLIRKGIITAIGIIKLGESENAKKTVKRKKYNRRITDLPAPKPLNPEAELPSGLKTLIKELKSGKRKHILLQSDDIRLAEELGRRLYHKLDERKIGKHIGWLCYEKLENGRPVIETCINDGFVIYNDVDDYTARRSKRLDFMSNPKRHTILFVKIVKYRKDKDDALERYNNLKGLSMILMSKTEIQGFKTYLVTENGGELLCDLKN